MPIIGRAAADDTRGALRDLDHAYGYRTLKTGTPIVEVIGTSLEPVALRGQYLILDPTDRSAKSGNIVVVTTADDRILTKRFDEQDGRVLLTSVNQIRPQPAVLLDWDDIRDIRVVIGVLFE